ncbi:chaperone protein dnaJ C76, chloroplastic-like [Hibiscus syriacus]|uniref:chaperone protein dnaJ C76, chloroplastic-like n=1 Tax=Hibiscus syriacus TaxID=106335 RepID=UPI0019203C97|nr:chaperone protein dnaJ C76, chloroplastic-like [Hibiscus syriacus]
MARLLSPVCTNAVKLHNPSLNMSRRSSWKAMPKPGASCTSMGLRRGCGRLKVTSVNTASTDSLADDYYALLGLLPDATQEEIKKAYYDCMKACHPDLSGNDPETTNFCMFINEVYGVSVFSVQRMVYDEIHGYAWTAINPFMDDSAPKDYVFVDEFSCIGCKNCANVTCDVFRIEADFGRARVHSQFGNPELVQHAIDGGPVYCIHLTSAAQLSLLEDEMTRWSRVERVNVALMLSGMGSSSNVFRMASSRWEKRRAKILEQPKVRMMQQKDGGKTDSYWTNLWGKPKEYNKSEEEVKEKARRAATAAIRWREYSRRGVDKAPTIKLPEALSNKDN